MIRVTIEMLPASGGPRRLLGMMDISNDGTSVNARRGNYQGRIYRKGSSSVVRQGRVENHARLDKVIWILLQKMLNVMYPEKCKACDERDVG